MRSLLLIIITAIFAAGILMIFNTSSAEVLDLDLEISHYRALNKQFLSAIIALMAGLLVWKIGYWRFLVWSPYLLLIFSFLLFLVLIPGIGREVNGSRRWFNLAGFSLQPSEFIKLFLPAFCIHRFCQSAVFHFHDFLKNVGLVLIPFLLILLEPNNGTVALLGTNLLLLCFVMRVPWRWWALPVIATICIGSIFASQLPYVTGRLKVYLNPELDILGRGHQPHQAKIAAGSGQLFGKGPGNSWQKWSYLPEAQNDYIAAIFAEEFGFVGILLLILAYMGLGLLGFAIAQAASDPAGSYLAAAIMLSIIMQTFLNLGVVSGLLPSTGLNLPFFSQGGSSLIANAMGMGLLFTIRPAGKLSALSPHQSRAKNHLICPRDV